MNGEITSIKVNGEPQPIENHSVNISGGGDVFEIYIKQEYDKENSTYYYTPDKSLPELYEAYTAGKRIIVNTDITDANFLADISAEYDGRYNPTKVRVYMIEVASIYIEGGKLEFGTFNLSQIINETTGEEIRPLSCSFNGMYILNSDSRDETNY